MSISGGNSGQHDEDVAKLQGDIGLSDTLKERSSQIVGVGHALHEEMSIWKGQWIP